MQTASKKVITGWAMFDWANSVYNLVITTTFFPAYFAVVTSIKNFPGGIRFLGRTYVNTELKDYVMASGFLVIACLSPVLSSVADYRGNKKKFMQFFCYMGAAACSLLYFFDKDHVFFGLFCLMMAGIGFYGSQVFYNAYLPEIAADADMDRVSAKGYALGYIGSVLMQLVGFALVVLMPGSATPLKITFLLVGLWWIGFAQITFRALPVSVKKQQAEGVSILTGGFIELKKVWTQLRHLPVLRRYLPAFFFYSMGVQTVMLVAIDFGIKELKLADNKLIITAVLIQLVAIAGAIGMSKLSRRMGNLPVLMLTVMLWIGICVAGYFMRTENEFYVLASLVGLVMGGIQSMSRSTYSKFMPPTSDTASFFSFYDVTEKLAIVIGLVSFGLIEGMTHSMRNSLLMLTGFFIMGLGGLLLTSLAEKKQVPV